MWLDFWKLFGPVVGVIIGALLTYGVSVHNQRFQREQEARKDRQNLRNRRIERLRTAYEETLLSWFSAPAGEKAAGMLDRLDMLRGLLALEPDVDVPGSNTAAVAGAAAETGTRGRQLDEYLHAELGHPGENNSLTRQQLAEAFQTGVFELRVAMREHLQALEQSS